MTLQITNLERTGLESFPLEEEHSATVIVSSFQVNQKLFSIRTRDNKEKVKAALQAIGLRPVSQQGGHLLILQTNQVHIRGGEL